MSTLAALDRKLSALIQFDDRPRNENGQFDTSADEGMNPHAMHSAYTAPLLKGGALGAVGLAAASTEAGQGAIKNAAGWLGKKIALKR
ncbi:MAG: hypothetical protein WCO60_18415 [Verrucomicrobiota bacterium]